MRDFVSSRTIGMAALATLSITWGVIVGLLGQPTTGPWSVGLIGLLALSAAVWVGFRSTRSMAQVIGDVDREPLLATASGTSVRPAAGSANGGHSL